MTVIVSEKSVDLALYVSVSACSSLILIKISYRYQTEDKYDVTWLVYLYYAINILASGYSYREPTAKFSRSSCDSFIFASILLKRSLTISQ